MNTNNTINPELISRIIFLLVALVIFRFGTHITIPFISPIALASIVQDQQGTILDMFNMFSGGVLERLSIFTLGIMPYISSSIIVQLMSATVPSLKQLKQEGESGRRKITQYTRMGTVLLAVFQSYGISIALQSQSAGGVDLVTQGGFAFSIITVITLTTGTLFLMWLGEQITEKGIGNGISMIIVAGIVSGLPSAVGSTLSLVDTGEIRLVTLGLLFALILGVIAFVVLMEKAQRRIAVNYAKRGKNSHSSNSYLPFKINQAGVIPPIFASSIILFPATIGGWLSQKEGLGWIADVTAYMAPGQPLYILVYGLAIIGFTFFYTALTFDAKETADNLQKSGGFIPGIRPGENSANYIDAVVSRLTASGSLYIAAVCLIPEFLILLWNVPFYFGGTSILIIVVVTIDFLSQFNNYQITNEYKNLMNVRGFN